MTGHLLPGPGDASVRGEDIPCVTTAVADEFRGPIPVGPFEVYGRFAAGATPIPQEVVHCLYDRYQNVYRQADGDRREPAPS